MKSCMVTMSADVTPPIDCSPDVGNKPLHNGWALRNQLRNYLGPGGVLSASGVPVNQQARNVLEYLYSDEFSHPLTQYNRPASEEIVRALVEQHGLPPHIARQIEKWHRVAPEYMVVIAFHAMAGLTLENAYWSIQDD